VTRHARGYLLHYHEKGSREGKTFQLDGMHEDVSLRDRQPGYMWVTNKELIQVVCQIWNGSIINSLPNE
jgi:hypothetical protein